MKNVGLIVSSVGHIALLTWALVSLPSPSTHDVSELEILPIDLVSVSDVTDVVKGEATAEVKDQVKEATKKAAEPVEKIPEPAPKVEPKPKQAAPKEKAQPEPAKVEPEPVPEPEPAPQPEPEPQSHNQNRSQQRRQSQNLLQNLSRKSRPKLHQSRSQPCPRSSRSHLGRRRNRKSRKSRNGSSMLMLLRLWPTRLILLPKPRAESAISRLPLVRAMGLKRPL